MKLVSLSLLVAFAFCAPPTPSPTGTLSSTPQQCGFLGLTCLQVTEAASFVNCNQTSHQCQCAATFEGNASPANKCRCPAPKKVYFPSFPLGGGVLSDSTWTPANWGFGDPICVDLAELQALKAAQQRNQKHMDLVMIFFNNTLGPTRPAEILASAGVPQLSNVLHPNVKSRISPAGTFNGYEGVVEYFYGFVASGTLIVENIVVREISATGNNVGIKADLWLHNFAAASTGGHPPEFWNLTTFAFFQFTENADYNLDLIKSIDVSVPNLGILLDIPDPAIRANIIAFTCSFLTLPIPQNGNKPGGTCGSQNVFNGATPQQQFSDCMLFYTTQIPYGTRDRNNANNFVCRQLHSILTPYRPVIHCPHSGRTGGTACIDFTYESYYQEEGF